MYFIQILCVTGKRGNVEINNSSQARIDPGPLDLIFSSLSNELKRYPTSPVLVVVLINPNHYISNPDVSAFQSYK